MFKGRGDAANGIDYQQYMFISHSTNCKFYGPGCHMMELKKVKFPDLLLIVLGFRHYDGKRDQVILLFDKHKLSCPWGTLSRLFLAMTREMKFQGF